MVLKSSLTLYLYYFIGTAHAYVVLQNSGPTVVGAKVSFRAIIREAPPPYNGEHLKYVFSSLDGRYYTELFTTERSVNFTVEFNKDLYKAGNYVFEVVVKKRNDVGIYDIPFGIDRCTVVLTDLLNGHLITTQNGINKSNGVVFAREPVKHTIMLSDREMDYLSDKELMVFWYLNCSLSYITPVLSTHSLYDSYGTYNLVVLVSIVPTDSVNTTTTNEVIEETKIYRQGMHHINPHQIDLNIKRNREMINISDKFYNLPCDAVPKEYVHGFYNQTIHIVGRDSTSSVENVEKLWLNSIRSSKAGLNVTTSATKPRHYIATPTTDSNTTSTTWNRNISVYEPIPPLNTSSTSATTFLNGTIDVSFKPELGTSWSNSSFSLSNITSPLASIISNSSSKPFHLKLALNMISHGTFNVEQPQITEN